MTQRIVLSAVVVFTVLGCGGSQEKEAEIDLPSAAHTTPIPRQSLDEEAKYVLNVEQRKKAVSRLEDIAEPKSAEPKSTEAEARDSDSNIADRLSAMSGQLAGAGPTKPRGGDLRGTGEVPRVARVQRARKSRPSPRKSKSTRSSYGLGGLGKRGTGSGGGGTIGGRGHGYGQGARYRVIPQERSDWNREGYADIQENDYHEAKAEPLSTFSIDVDSASYANTRRFLTSGQKPPASAVRIEEMINYFSYDYPAPRGDVPFSVHHEVTEVPWNSQHRLVHIGIQGRKIDMREAPASNLVFLIDVSGSMHAQDKLPLLKQGLSLLANNLRKQDRVAMVVYAGSSGLVLPSTSGAQRNKILSALERLRAGGSTNGAGGIELAYRVARKNFIRGGINRVILATDGDFNVGVSANGELARLIAKKRKSGVFLSVLGFGQGNLQDHKMETLADKGNGNYAYIDSIREAKKVLVREVGSTLVTIAKDVKIQVEFNPAKVKSYRLIGYENRKLAARDFNDDKKDAGEIGAGHSVTALYEVVPVGADSATGADVDPLRYQKQDLSVAADSGELLTLKIRYKQPQGSVSKKLSWAVRDQGNTLQSAGHNERMAAGIAAFGMLLRESKHKGASSYSLVKDLIRPTLASDRSGDRAELFHLINQAESL